MRTRALTRTPRAPSTAIEWIRGDLSDPRALRHLVDGADAVVHCAGVVRGRTAEDFDAVNVTGTQRVVDAARAAGVERFLLVSSLAAREPRLSHYASSKRRGEDVVTASDLAWTILRPPAVYGPGDEELLPLFRLMMSGIAIVPGHAGRTSLIYVTDLAGAIAAWLDSTAARSRFEPDDGTPNGYDWDELIAIAATVRGAPVRRIGIPRALLNAVGTVNLSIARVLNRSPMLTPAKVRELFHEDWVCRGDDIGRALNWTPTVRFAQGLRLSFPG